MSFNLNTIVRRGVFDLGPYGIKFALADVGLYHSKISELHYYAKTTSSFEADVVPSAIAIINSYKLDAQTNFPTRRNIEFFGIAREPFITMKDGKKLLDEISRHTKVKISTISVQEERHLAYGSLKVVLGKKIEKSIIFNLTANNTSFFDSKKFHEIDMTCRKFYELVKNETRDRKHIYPLENKHVKRLIDLALDSVKIDESIVTQIQSKLKLGFNVVGRGAIHNHVAQHYCNLYEFTKVMTQNIDASFYSKHQINNVIKLMSTSDLTNTVDLMYDVIKHEQAEQELTNLVLIYAIMHKAGISKVHTVSAKNIFGLLVQRAY